MTELTFSSYQPPDGSMLMTAEQASVFSDATRNEIMMLLAERPATTSQLADAMKRPKGTVGHHLKVLEEAGLIEVVRTRKVRALTEKYYGRLARTYIFPDLDEAGIEKPPFMLEALNEMRPPEDGETGMFTIRRARLSLEQAQKFNEAMLALAEEFAAAPRDGTTVYGLIAGIYPTDKPSLREDDE